MNIFTPSLSKRKQILKRISHDHPQWKVRISVAIILWITAVAIVAGIISLLILHPTSTEGIFIFLCTAVCLACIPHFTALSVKNTAKYKCGLPYTSYANGSLLLQNDSLEYVFWRVGPHEPAAYSSKRAVYRDDDKFTYAISKKDIYSIELKDDICLIKGNGRVKFPEWAEEDLTVKRTCSEFSFILAFEQDATGKIIEEWWER